MKSTNLMLLCLAGMVGNTIEKPDAWVIGSWVLLLIFFMISDFLDKKQE